MELNASSVGYVGCGRVGYVCVCFVRACVCVWGGGGGGLAVLCGLVMHVQCVQFSPVHVEYVRYQ